MRLTWPDNKKFAFTIVDDTDMSTVFNTKPVYDLLLNLGIRTTKTVWIYPSRDKFTGGCLSDNDYMTFILWLRDNDFEIAFHGAGSGDFKRQEIILSLEIFNQIIGYYPKLHVNHANNLDGIYWGQKRFSLPLKIIYKLLFLNGLKFSGENIDSSYFWGDICKHHVKYIRNRIYTNINTLKYDPYMPYKEVEKELYSNYWFSSSDGYDVNTFCSLMKTEDIDRLSEEGGCCIAYTHFGSGFVDEYGKLSQKFKENIEYLSSKNAWFAPASEILDYMLENKGSDEYLSALNSFKMDAIWFVERVYRKLFMKE
ncbi:MAG TPA: hypothetical protein DCK76_06205 [Desulfotomaculum sp.]|nr:MAG: hypothetical protein XD84_0316 [Desulfotomaculum sp. 46_80]HAG10967.1 hypothetical protein [Desulfotomaculum sp.]